MKIITHTQRNYLLGLILVCMTSIAGMAQTPYGWRGPTRDGIYPETGLLKTWPAEGPTQLWETMDAGKGYSSPVIVGDRLYITGMNENETREVFSAYSLDGKKIYQVAYGAPWTGSYPETRTTPAIEGNKAYVISGSGEIVCLDITDGSEIWKVDGGTVFQRKTGNWGTAECPLVFDNKVIYTPSGDKTTMVALDAQTGETVWESKPLGDPGAYVAPKLITYRGKRQIVGSTGVSVIGVNPDNGTIEWTFDDWKRPQGGGRPPQGAPGTPPAGNQGTPPPGGQATPPQRAQNQPPQGGQSRGPSGAIAPNTALYKDGRVFFCQGYDVGSYMLQLNDDMTAVTLAWSNKDLDTHHGGYVLIDGVIYGSNWITNTSGKWVGLDWETGATLFEDEWTGGKGKGSIIYADGMLYCYDERRGFVGLVTPTRNAFEVVNEFRITKGDGPFWAHPVIVDGVLYIRHAGALMAYSIK